MPFGDVSTQAVMPEPRQGHVELLAKQDGIIAGLDVFARVFALLDPLTVMIPSLADGAEVCCGDLVADVEGDVRALLEGERTALNYLQRMAHSAMIPAAAMLHTMAQRVAPPWSARVTRA